MTLIFRMCTCYKIYILLAHNINNWLKKHVTLLAISPNTIIWSLYCYDHYGSI